MSGAIAGSSLLAKTGRGWGAAGSAKSGTGPECWRLVWKRPAVNPPLSRSVVWAAVRLERLAFRASSPSALLEKVARAAGRLNVGR